MDKPQSMAAIVSLVFSNCIEVREVARSMYYKLKQSREFLEDVPFSLSDDPWNALYYKWNTNDSRSAIIQFAKKAIEKGDDIGELKSEVIAFE